MLDRERHDTILRHLKQHTYAAVRELADATSASEATVRRDLQFLAGQGSILRVRGGAEISEKSWYGVELLREQPFEQRRQRRDEEKRRIAEYAASMCNKGDTIFLDGGSTTYEMVRFLKSAGVRVVTNSIIIAEDLSRISTEPVILSGGIVFPDSQLVLSPYGDDTFKHYVADFLFMGAGAIGEHGVMNNDMQVIQTEQAMMQHADRLVVLADSSKFSRNASFIICEIEEVDTLVTDNDAPEDLRHMLLSKGLELVTV